ncbi:hypothetical protein Bhyg_14773 [Pseudolycoriella hygida]|uniref:Uncharacterized protein n=1 Tax=Pseudolycoriella hygida TaxID=35572 RepID=A0A9Q0MQL3_9DIPT|nr:hypothetical protein Bhyg_14773 [Pseudolycoriella hygida]
MDVMAILRKIFMNFELQMNSIKTNKDKLNVDNSFFRHKNSSSNLLANVPILSGNACGVWIGVGGEDAGVLNNGTVIIFSRKPSNCFNDNALCKWKFYSTNSLFSYYLPDDDALYKLNKHDSKSFLLRNRLQFSVKHLRNGLRITSNEINIHIELRDEASNCLCMDFEQTMFLKLSRRNKISENRSKLDFAMKLRIFLVLAPRVTLKCFFKMKIFDVYLSKYKKCWKETKKKSISSSFGMKYDLMWQLNEVKVFQSFPNVKSHVVVFVFKHTLHDDIQSDNRFENGVWVNNLHEVLPAPHPHIEFNRNKLET